LATVTKPRKRSAAKASLVLVVDDFAAARHMYGHFLTSSGYRVEEAQGGPEAIEKGLALRPDLILMDLAMPGMDGWEAIHRLKSHERTKDSLIVVVTGMAHAGGAKKAKAAGCDAYLLKPCLPETLLGVVRSLLGRRAGRK
jgi:two-component system cell cycle response regulator DivK